MFKKQLHLTSGYIGFSKNVIQPQFFFCSTFLNSIFHKHVRHAIEHKINFNVIIKILGKITKVRIVSCKNISTVRRFRESPRIVLKKFQLILFQPFLKSTENVNHPSLKEYDNL